MQRSALLLLVLALVACAARLPLTRTEATSAAMNWCVREGRSWGDPAEVKAPGVKDAEGSAWWTVRFPAPAGETRIVLVDADTGWTKAGR